MGARRRFTGMTLQAIPFTPPGCLRRRAHQAYSPRAHRQIPDEPSRVGADALLAAFVLPVCDCSARSDFRSPLHKGFPLSAAATLMLASPRSNPLVRLDALRLPGRGHFVAARVGLRRRQPHGSACHDGHSPARTARGESHRTPITGATRICCEHGCEMPDQAWRAGGDGSLIWDDCALIGSVAASTVAQVLWPVSSLLSRGCTTCWR